MSKKNIDRHKALKLVSTHKQYKDLLSGISTLLEEARRSAARSVNTILTVTYWEVGRRIVEFEQKGKAFAEYGEEIIMRLAEDLTTRFGRGFSRRNLFQMRLFYLTYRKKVQTVSAQLGIKKLRTRKVQTVSAKLTTTDMRSH